MQISNVIPNFRDLAGLPTVSATFVPQGRLARTAALLQARAVRSALLRGRMPGAIYFDLRTDAEIEYHGPLDLPGDWTYRHCPIFDADLGHPVEQDRFDEMLRRYRPVVLEIAEAAATSPVVVSCSLGKDRTGFVVAALLHMLDVSRELILHDYELSNECLARFRFDRPYSLVEADRCAAWLDFLSDNLDAPSATVAGLRDILRPYHCLDSSDAPG
jgi:protein-tyrosine phosphatase